MDDKKLQDILKTQPTPAIDENAKKRALNLANAAFAQEQKKNKKTSQGIAKLLRLIGISNTKTRNETMEEKKNKKFMYGGMATAMAVIVVVGLGVNQLDDTVERFNTSATLSGLSEEKEAEDPLARWRMIQEERIEYDARKKLNRQGNKEVASKPAGSQDGTIHRWRRLQDERIEDAISRVESEGDKSAGPTMEQAKSLESDDVAVKQSSTVPSKEKRLEIPEEEVVVKDPLAVWRAKQDERLQRQLAELKMEVFKENPFTLTTEAPVSTFSSDVDTASYSIMRKSLNNGTLPQRNALRIEELINYFDYDYAVPQSKSEPFKPSVIVTNSPWAEGKKLMHIGIKGYEITGEKPRSNLVFLLDVSGSMNSHDKLPLLKNSLKLLLDTLGPEDTVAIAVYAGAAGTVLEPTRVAEKHKIISALERLNAGGSTAGAAGIRLAYDLAQENFDEEAINRVILATDGDFNVGISNQDDLKSFVEEKRKSGVFLSVLGFGRGNYNDHTMQTLAQNGNGVAAYIDSLNEARKVLVEEASSSLFPIAKDVKFQIEFNPAAVAEYRLIGYETRALKREDFNNDKVDAGDIGAGHSVTAIYEFTPVGGQTSVDPLRYGKTDEVLKRTSSDDAELAFLKVRYKLPHEETSKLITTPVLANAEYKRDMTDTYFATAVAAFGQILKGGTYTGSYNMDDVIKLAQAGKGADEYGYRSEFIQLVRLAKSLSGE